MKAALTIAAGVIVALGCVVAGVWGASRVEAQRVTPRTRPNASRGPNRHGARAAGYRVLARTVIGVAVFIVGIASLAVLESFIDGPSWAETLTIWMVVLAAVVSILGVQYLHTRRRIRSRRGPA